MKWILKNIGTVIIGLIILAAVCAACRKIIIDRRQGKTSCGRNSSCSSCPSSQFCSSREKTEDIV